MMRRSRNTYEDQDDRSALLATILNKHACAFSTAMKHRSVQRQRGGLASRLSRTPDHLEEPDELLVLQLEGHRPDPRVHLAHLHTARPPQSTRRPPQTTRPSGPSRTSAHGAPPSNDPTPPSNDPTLGSISHICTRRHRHERGRSEADGARAGRARAHAALTQYLWKSTHDHGMLVRKSKRKRDGDSR